MPNEVRPLPDPFHERLHVRTVFDLREGDFGFVDARNRVLRGTKKLEAELILRGARVMWEPNGISARSWDEPPPRH